MYHRVAEPIADPGRLAVSPDNFEQQLLLLREHATVVPLSFLADRHERGVSSRGMVAITFDDGYPDVLDVALPLLQKHQCPATVFLPTDYMTDQRPFWWDVLAHVFLELADLPQELDLEFEGRRHQFSLNSPDARRAAHDQIWATLRLSDEPPRREAIARIEEWAALNDLQWSSAHRCISANEAMRAHQPGFFDIGAHTKSHPSLPTLPPHRQREEIAGGVSILREMLGGDVSSFAYPYGDYDEQAVDIVRAAGIRYACTTHHRRIGRRAAPLEMPRLNVTNLNASRFTSKILAHG